jgi:hypothetical protein
MKWIRSGLHIVKRYLRRNTVFVFLVPDDTYGMADGVAAIAPHVTNRVTPKRLFRVDRWCPHVTDVVKVKPSADGILMVVFAHPAATHTGFSVNPGPQSARNVLLLTWWQEPKLAFRMLVAHVCNGAAILNTPPWRTVFPQWVSYDGWVGGYYETPVARARWGRIADATLDATADGGTPRSVANRIRFAYIREMVDIEDHGRDEDGDPLTYMFFQDALDTLVVSG